MGAKARKHVVVTIDGPAGAGKSTAARTLAKTLSYRFLDTGAIYRTLALAAQQQGISWDDEAHLASLAAELPISFVGAAEGQAVHLAQTDVSALIRTPDIAEGASRVSAHPAVRAALLDLQRHIAASGAVVAEGRDTGTVVFPDAAVKFFLTARDEVRAARRGQELAEKGEAVDANELAARMRARDQADSQRKVAPLKPAHDAIIIDSSDLTMDAVVEAMRARVHDAEANSK